MVVEYETEWLDQRQHAWIRDVADEHHGATLSLAGCINGTRQQTRTQSLSTPLRMDIQLKNAENATLPGADTVRALPRDITVDGAICGADADVTSADARQDPLSPTDLVDEPRVARLGSITLPEQPQRGKISSCRRSNHAPAYSTNESTGS